MKVLVEFTDDQFQTVYRFVNANRHRNKDLSEVANVLKEANHLNFPHHESISCM